jgi:shikimate dehydrogenase
VLVVGAGGATRGILGPLLDASPTQVVVANRTAARAQELATAFAEARSGSAAAVMHGCGYDRLAALLAAGPFDLVIHATSLGLQGEAPPLPPAIFGRASVVYDLGYGAIDTPFVRWARAQGVTRAEQGYGMLVEQAAEAFLLWRGVRPDTALLHRLGPAHTAPTSPTEAR